MMVSFGGFGECVCVCGKKGVFVGFTGGGSCDSCSGEEGSGDSSYLYELTPLTTIVSSA